MVFKVRGNNTHQITKRGMSFAWTFSGSLINIRLRAPTQGWLAVGFNSKNQLANTNLIMGAIYPSGELVVQERAILRAGTHRAKVELGLVDRLTQISGCPDGRGTAVSFSMSTAVSDKYSYSLVRGQKIHLLLAYSQAPEFDHHSRMRTHLLLKL